MSAELQVGGLARLSTCDWPGQLVATVFCQGCAWSCRYCHNPHLQAQAGQEQTSWRDVLQFLGGRRALLDGVVFSGGEPTLQPALIDAIRAVRELGFGVGLHTAGLVPELLAEALPSVDWVGLDIKGPLGAYARITGAESSGSKAFASLDLLVARRVPFEVRTTLHSGLLSLAEMLALRDRLLERGVTHYAVQRFRRDGLRDQDRLSLPKENSWTLPADFGLGFRSFILR